MQRKKIGKSLLSFMMICAIVLQSTVSVFAKSVALDRMTSMSSYLRVKEHTDNLGAYHEEQGKRVFKIDGQYAYCIESDVGLSADKIYEDGANAQEILSSKPNILTSWQQKYDMLAALLSMVPTTIHNNSKTEHIQWLVGQTMIWEITGEERGKGFTYVGNQRAGSMAYRDSYMWTYQSDQATFTKYYQELEQKMLSYWIIPSFMSQTQGQKTITLDQYDGTYYYTKVTDANHVLNQYDYQSEGLSIDVQGNEMTLKSLSLTPVSLKATLKASYKCKAPLFWSDGNFQRTVTSGDLTPAAYKAYVNTKVGQGSIKVVKNDCFKHPIAGAVFEITSPSQHVSTHSTNAQGEIFLEDIESGTYIVREKNAPTGYLINESTFEMKVYPGQITTQTVVDNEPMGTIELTKAIDTDITNGNGGDAYLKGNEYSLYAREKITNKAGQHTYFEKDQLIAKAETDEFGKLTFSSLYLGEYYIKETRANASLMLNEQVYNISLTYKDMHTSIVTKRLSTSNQVNSQRIQIFKQGEKGDVGVVNGLAGAEFTFVLNSEYERVGFENAKKYFIGVTDSQGFLTTDLLPYGVYRVKETKTPQGYYGTNDFLVTIDKDSSEYEVGYQIKRVSVNNAPFESLLKIVKTDQETGKIIQRAGATFKIKNLDTDEYVSYIDWSAFPNILVNQWTTHDDGSITLNTKLQSGRYQLEEIKAPDGYLVEANPLTFTIDKEHYDISSDGVTPITIVKFTDQSVKGKITILKNGEVLTDYKNGKFVYEMQGIANAKFGIYASEDILDPSHDGTVLFQKGELVEVLVTKEKGKVTSSLLPLGEYEYKELEAPFGYVLNDEIKTFSLTHQNQEIVYEHISVANERQKISIDVGKKDSESLEYVEGALFSLIANRDIYNGEGKVIVEAGTVIETIQSSKKGKVSFVSDLPIDLTPEYAVMPLDESIDIVGDTNALYMIEETKQPDGYVSKKVHYYVEARYTGERVLSYSYDFLNDITKTIIYKVDAKTSLGLPGAKLQLIDKELNVVIDEWISEEKGHIIKGLVVGKTYILHEVAAPTGYMLALNQEIVIQDTSQMQTFTLSNDIIPVKTLGDEPKIEIPKTGDSTIILSYLLMGIGAIAFFTFFFKKD